MTLTALQTDLVRLIEQHHRKYGYAPSVRELQTATNLSSMSTIHRALVVLRAQGLVEWEPNRYRTIRVPARH